MSLLNYLAGGMDSDHPFNLHRYPHHLQRFLDEVAPWNLHDRDIRHLRDWYERTRTPSNDVPDDDGIVLPVEENDDADEMMMKMVMMMMMMMAMKMKGKKKNDILTKKKNMMMKNQMMDNSWVVRCLVLRWLYRLQNLNTQVA